VPVRRDYRKIALRGAVAFALMAAIVSGILIYQWQSRVSRYQQALRLLEGGQPGKALVHFSGLADGGFKDSAQRANEASVALASVHLDNGRYGKAIRLLQQLEEKSWPGSGELLAKARYEEALFVGDRALKRKNYAKAIMKLEYAQSLESTQETEQELRAAREGQLKSARAEYREGMRLMRQRKHSEALTRFDAALRIYPEYELAGKKRAEARRLVDMAEQKERRLAAIRTQPAQRHVEIVSWSWSVSDFSVATMNVRVKNNAPFGIKDVQFRIHYMAPSGTVLDRGSETAYQTIPPGKTRWFKLEELADRRSERASIAIVDAKWEWEQTTRNLDW
jgi:tetratricopeptide (TPR) repeat protein